jgi:hypothetical protein
MKPYHIRRINHRISAMGYSFYFNPSELKIVRKAERCAADLVSNYYCVAPREWQRMPYEVKTLRLLASAEVAEKALAQTVCYSFRREAGPLVLEGDIYRICLQDNRILDVARNTETKLEPLLIYILTHELVHVVRFGQQLQRVDLPDELRANEEMRVEQTTRAILTASGNSQIDQFLSNAMWMAHKA